MWKQKIGLSIGNSYSVPTCEVVALLKRIGFDAISPEWESKDMLCEIVAAAKECDMEILSLHAPFGQAADMWSPDTQISSGAKKDILIELEACVAFHIPILVVHTWIGFDYIFDEAALHYANFDEIVAFAKAHKVTARSFAAMPMLLRSKICFSSFS